jgi:hypothetical protein
MNIYKFFFINIFEWWIIAEREEILREIKFFKFFNIIEVLGDYIRVINHTSPTPSHLLGIIDLSSPSNPLEPVGTRSNPLGPVVTRWDPLETVWSCVLTFLWWGRLHREKKD